MLKLALFTTAGGIIIAVCILQWSRIPVETPTLPPPPPAATIEPPSLPSPNPDPVPTNPISTYPDTQNEGLGTLDDQALVSLVHEELANQDFAAAFDWAARLEDKSLRSNALAQAYAQAYRAKLLTDTDLANSALDENTRSAIRDGNYLD